MPAGHPQAADQRSRGSWKYGSPGSIRWLSSASQASRRAMIIDRRPTLRFERMVDRPDQPDLERVIEIDVVGDRAVEHRLAVFGSPICR